MRTSTTWRPALALLALLLALLPAARTEARRETDIRAAFIVDSTLVDPATAEAAGKPFFDVMGGRAKLSYSITADVSPSGLLELMKSGKINVAFGSALQYTKLADNLQLVPISITMPFGRKHFSLLLLARRGAGLSRLEQLRGKSITYSTDDINQIYLSVLLHRRGEKGPGAFFGKITRKKNRKAAVMDLLMRETDACLVSNDLYDTMAALNPQLKNKLIVLERSKPFAQNTMFARADIQKHLIGAVRETSFRLHKHPAGRQILLLFRIKSLARPGRSDFDTIRALWREYKKLAGKQR